MRCHFHARLHLLQWLSKRPTVWSWDVGTKSTAIRHVSTLRKGPFHRNGGCISIQVNGREDLKAMQGLYVLSVRTEHQRTKEKQTSFVALNRCCLRTYVSIPAAHSWKVSESDEKLQTPPMLFISHQCRVHQLVSLDMTMRTIEWDSRFQRSNDLAAIMTSDQCHEPPRQKLWGFGKTHTTLTQKCSGMISRNVDRDGHQVE